ncbi:MAG: HDOD domain-containing protein [Gammaproteobacteria bacterium]|nr:HDOD domain-containing protein [Gammaproteobacteria bacterium]
MGKVRFSMTLHQDTQLKMPAITQESLQVLDMLAAEDEVSLLTLSNLIAKDPNLTATVLRYANAPLYRRMIETTNVRNAVSLLGIKNVRLAVVVASMRALHAEMTSEMQAILEHCTQIAATARVIALYNAPFLADDIELTALVHDMGALVLAANTPKIYRQVADQLLADEALSALDVEQRLLGTQRAEIMQQLAVAFRLPEVVVQAVNAFFARTVYTDANDVVARHVVVLHLAHGLRGAQPNCVPNFTREIALLPVEAWQKLLGLTTEHLNKIKERAGLV